MSAQEDVSGSIPEMGTMKKLFGFSRGSFYRSPDVEVDVTDASIEEIDAEYVALRSNYPIVTANDRNTVIVRFGKCIFHEMVAIPGRNGLSDFAIGKFPITEMEWRVLICGTDPRWEKSRKPVTYVSASQAERVIEKLGLRLPSEQEWNLAAYGTDGRPYPWGSAPPSDRRLIWAREFYRFEPECVGTRPDGASPFGVEDMLGNVRQWTSTGAYTARVSMGMSFESDWIRDRDNTQSHKDNKLADELVKELSPMQVGKLATKLVLRTMRGDSLGRRIRKAVMGDKTPNLLDEIETGLRNDSSVRTFSMDIGNAFTGFRCAMNLS